MDALAGPYLASAALLVVAGGSKLLDPASLVRALRSARLPASAVLVRLLAAGEVLLGLAAIGQAAAGLPLLLAAAAVAVTAYLALALLPLLRAAR